MKQHIINLRDDVSSWIRGWRFYLEKRLGRFGVWFEGRKDVIVDFLMARRGTYRRPFLHFSLGVLFVVGALSAPILASSYPGVATSLTDLPPASAVVTTLDLAEYGVQTQFSDKPRDQIITHIVEKGETLSTIAETYGVSVDTIKWANDLKRDSLSIGQELRIPPVTGVVHKVREGETIYTIAKKYKTEAQKIVNFPFNDFSDLDTFAINVGQTLVVPDGVINQAPAILAPRPPVIAGGSGQYQWPTSGVITQYPIWYHNALDIASPAAPQVVAAGEGVVTSAQYLRYGYGQHIQIDHGGGMGTLYAHLSEIYVGVGDRVGRGQVIGRMGSTGRSTGTHLHFEVRVKGAPVNPLGYLK